MKLKGINLGKSVRIKDGKVERVHAYRSVSDKIKATKSKKTRVVPKQKALALPPGPRKSR